MSAFSQALIVQNKLMNRIQFLNKMKPIKSKYQLFLQKK